jgi:hypothetical protein
LGDGDYKVNGEEAAILSLVLLGDRVGKAGEDGKLRGLRVHELTSMADEVYQIARKKAGRSPSGSYTVYELELGKVGSGAKDFYSQALDSVHEVGEGGVEDSEVVKRLKDITGEKYYIAGLKKEA